MWKSKGRDIMKWRGTLESDNLIVADNLFWSGGTKGSVLFAGDNGVLSQDNSNLFWDDTNNRLGIGTPSPQEKLHVYGTGVQRLEVESSNSNPVLKLTNHLGSYGWLVSNSENKFYLYDYNAPAYRMSIDENGKVGIGTTSPDGKLHVHTATAGSVDAAATADDLVVENSAAGGISVLTPNGSASNILLGSPSDVSGGKINWKYDDLLMNVGTGTASAELAFLSGNSVEAVRIDDAGNVGIGTTSPTSQFDISATGGATGGLRIGDSQDSDNVRHKMRLSNAGTGTIYEQYNSAETLTNQIRTDGDCYFNMAGNFGIGTDSPSQLLEINSSSVDSNIAFSYGGNTAKGTVGGFGTDDGGYAYLGGNLYLDAALKFYDNTESGWIAKVDSRNTVDKFQVGRAPATGGANPTVDYMFTIDSSGNVGIGTSSPDTTLQVVGDTKLGDDNTNYVEIGTTGDMVFVSGAGLAYGSIYGHERAATIPLTQNVYSICSHAALMEGSTTHNVTANASNAAFTIVKAGHYKVDWSISGEAETSSCDVDCDLFINTTEQSDGAARRLFGAANEIGNMGGSAILDCAVNDVITLRLKNNTNDNDLTIYNINISVVQIGGT